MEFDLNELALETTRKCNLTCPGYCMRGPSQNVDLTPEIVDSIFDNNKIRYIYKICFSGGEPTLNPGIIIYTINKIIENDIDVGEIALVTNGQIYVPEITLAFNRFNEYRNAKVLKRIKQTFANFGEKFLNDQLKVNTDNHARITFSTDKYHHPIKQEVREAYFRDARGLKITETGEKEEKDIKKSGFSTIGKEIDYNQALRIMPNGKNSTFLLETIYITANGNIVIGGDGAYNEMDKMNCGNITNTKLQDVVSEYGTTKDDKSKKILEGLINQESQSDTEKSL